jgi:DNA-binding transcriptional LysR family regulator
MIDVRQLRYFKAVAEALHFGRAAQQLHIAQPALSRQIQQLEKDLGVLLLRRNQRRFELTPAGALLLGRANRILDEIAKATIDVQRLHRGESGLLTVGFIQSATYWLLPAMLQRFRESYPDVQFDLREMSSSEQLAALPRGEIDVGILRPPVGNPELRVQTILEERLVLALPAQHRLAHQGKAALEDVAAEPFVLVSRQGSPYLHARILSMCEARGFSPSVVQTAAQLHTIIGLVGAGMGVAVVPETARRLNGSNVQLLQVEGAQSSVEIALAWRADREAPMLHSFGDVAELVVRTEKLFPAKKYFEARSDDGR